MLSVMTTKDERGQKTTIVTARVDSDSVQKLDRLAEVLRRSRSELVDFACQELIKLTPEEVATRMIRSTQKPKGR